MCVIDLLFAVSEIQQRQVVAQVFLVSACDTSSHADLL